MSETPDLIGDYKAGVSQMLTGLNGFVQALSSLIGDPSKVNTITIVTQNATAKIRHSCLRSSDSDEEVRIFGVVEVNWDHIMHSTVLSVVHEVLHLVARARIGWRAVQTTDVVPSLQRELGRWEVGVKEHPNVKRIIAAVDFSGCSERAAR